MPKSDITPIQEECRELGADKANFNETVISADHFSDLTDRTSIIEEQCELGVADANYNETVNTVDHFSDGAYITLLQEENCKLWTAEAKYIKTVALVTDRTPIKEEHSELRPTEAKYNERENTVCDLSDKKEICCDEIDQLKSDSETAIKQSSDRLTDATTKTSPWKRVLLMIKNQQQTSRKGGLNVTRRCPSIN